MGEAYEFKLNKHTFYIKPDRTGEIKGEGKTRDCVLMGILPRYELDTLKITLGLGKDSTEKAKVARQYLQKRAVELGPGESYAVWAGKDGNLKARLLPEGTPIKTHKISDGKQTALESLADGATNTNTSSDPNAPIPLD